MGDLDSDSPNDNGDHLAALQRGAEAQVREACRPGGSSASTKTNPIRGVEIMWRRNKDEESKLVLASKPVPDNLRWNVSLEGHV